MTIGRRPGTRIRKEIREGGETIIRMMKNQEMKEINDERGKNAKMNQEARTDVRVKTGQKKETDIANVAMMIIGQEKNAKFPANEVEHREQTYFHNKTVKFQYKLSFHSHFVLIPVGIGTTLLEHE